MSTLIVCGRIGSDGELKTLQSGTNVVSFSIADEIGWGDKKRVQWIKCAMFGERAAKLAPYLTKGSMVEVIGTPQIELWSDKKTQEARGTIALTVSEVKLHGGGKKDEAEPSTRPTARARAPLHDDAIPF